ncbi:uncharacterized protein ACB057_005875 [Neosynchiropus ocellatus]
MSETAEAHSSAFTTNRNCTIKITNLTHSYRLINPCVHMESGFPFSPPQPTIGFDKPEVCSFDKDDHTFSGAVGVMTYDVVNMSQSNCNLQLAIMFSVPFDYNLYKNWFGIGLFESSRPCDQALFQLMYDKADAKMTNEDKLDFSRQKANGSCLTHKRMPVVVRACMSDEGQAIIKLEVFEE